VQRSELLAPSTRLVARGGLGPCLVGHDHGEGVEDRVDCVDASQHGLGQVRGRDLTRCHGPGLALDTGVQQVQRVVAHEGRR
jgi:hypothetical protein